ncbi:MAG: hypothetical protein N2380_04580 [bacterium]|nr:hypothetical protein [bacterium]
MTSYDRVLSVFNQSTLDKIPIHHIGVSSKVASLLLGREAYVGGGIQQWREARALWEGRDAYQEFLERSFEDALEISDIFNMDLVRATYWRLPIKPSKKIDDYTFLYGDENKWLIRRLNPETEIFDIIAEYPPKGNITFEDLERELNVEERRIEEYNPTPEDFKEVLMFLRRLDNEKALRVSAGGVSIPLDTLWLEAVYLRPDLVKRYLNIQVNRAIKDITVLARLGVKIIFGGGDLANDKGPIYSPRVFRDFLLPSIKRITDVCHKLGIFYLFGSDGNLWPIAQELFIESGIDGYYEIDRKAGMDLKRLRINHPQLVLIGNISSYTLHVGSINEVIKETLDCLETAKNFGGIIVGCSNYIVPQTPLENVIAMIETINKYR